jgi:hypothetical protein
LHGRRARLERDRPAQANLVAFRAPADEMVAEVRAAILYAARKMDAPSQRRILRT